MRDYIKEVEIEEKCHKCWRKGFILGIVAANAATLIAQPFVDRIMDSFF